MKAFFLALSLLAASASATAADFVAPKLTGPVVDESGVLDERETRELSALLRLLNDRGKAQFTILITNSLQDFSIEQYGIKLAEAWQLGGKKDDKGLILIVAPTERRMRLEVGYGLEGEIPDVVAKRILDDTVRPYFKAGKMNDGIAAGTLEVAKILGLTADEIASVVSNPSAYVSSQKNPDSHLYLIFFVFLLVMIRIFINVALAGVLGFLGYLVLGPIGAFIGAILGFILGTVLRTLLGDRYRWIRWMSADGRPGAGSGGSWGGGGFGGGGGGWSGGGGGFGGGGSSSNW